VRIVVNNNIEVAMENLAIDVLQGLVDDFTDMFALFTKLKQRLRQADVPERRSSVNKLLAQEKTTLPPLNEMEGRLGGFRAFCYDNFPPTKLDNLIKMSAQDLKSEFIKRSRGVLSDKDIKILANESLHISIPNDLFVSTEGTYKSKGYTLESLSNVISSFCDLIPALRSSTRYYVDRNKRWLKFDTYKNITPQERARLNARLTMVSLFHKQLRTFVKDKLSLMSAQVSLIEKLFKAASPGKPIVRSHDEVGDMLKGMDRSFGFYEYEAMIENGLSEEIKSRKLSLVTSQELKAYYTERIAYSSYVLNMPSTTGKETAREYFDEVVKSLRSLKLKYFRYNVLSLSTMLSEFDGPGSMGFSFPKPKTTSIGASGFTTMKEITSLISLYTQASDKQGDTDTLYEQIRNVVDHVTEETEQYKKDCIRAFLSGVVYEDFYQDSDLSPELQLELVVKVATK